MFSAMKKPFFGTKNGFFKKSTVVKTIKTTTNPPTKLKI